jgi:hypothetical protein
MAKWARENNLTAAIITTAQKKSKSGIKISAAKSTPHHEENHDNSIIQAGSLFCYSDT